MHLWTRGSYPFRCSHVQQDKSARLNPFRVFCAPVRHFVIATLSRLQFLYNNLEH